MGSVLGFLFFVLYLVFCVPGFVMCSMFCTLSSSCCVLWPFRCFVSFSVLCYIYFVFYFLCSVLRPVLCPCMCPVPFYMFFPPRILYICPVLCYVLYVLCSEFSLLYFFT